MPCHHTSFEMRDGGLLCRTCGEPMGHSQVNVAYGVALMRPEFSVLMGDGVTGPSATEIRAREARNALANNAAARGILNTDAYSYQNAFPQPAIAHYWPDPEPPQSPILTVRRALAFTAIIASSVLGAGLLTHYVPLISAGAAGLGYFVVWAVIEARKDGWSGPFGIADTVRQEMRTHREAMQRPQVRCAVIAIEGFGGWR